MPVCLYSDGQKYKILWEYHPIKDNLTLRPHSIRSAAPWRQRRLKEYISERQRRDGQPKRAFLQAKTGLFGSPKCLFWRLKSTVLHSRFQQTEYQYVTNKLRKEHFKGDKEQFYTNSNLQGKIRKKYMRFQIIVTISVIQKRKEWKK